MAPELFEELLWSQAEEVVSEVIKIQPENAKAHYRRGQVQLC